MAASDETDQDLSHRLPWLLVFRAAVATALLALNLGADWLQSSATRISELLYAVTIGNFAVVLVLGVLLRAGTPALVLATVHLAGAVMTAALVVHATGGPDSLLSFLYLLAILDGAIIGGRRVGLVVASASCLAYGGQLVAQLYGLVPAGGGFTPSPSHFASAVITHFAAFFLTALLAGHLAALLRSAREEASSTRDDLARAESSIQALERDIRSKERLAAIGSLAAAIAHEIRNPLAAISGSVELMTNGAPDPTVRRKLATIVLREVERLNRLVGDFLVYARPHTPERARVDLAALVQDVRAMLQADAAWDGRELRVEMPERLEVSADAGQLRQVFWNLLRNAAEASPPGSPVELRARACDERGEPSVLIQVQDRGPGLTGEIREHLFEPFHTTKPQGTGLGLAVVHRIVHAHGGRVALDSAAGEGTTAHVILPRGGQ